MLFEGAIETGEPILRGSIPPVQLPASSLTPPAHGLDSKMLWACARRTRPQGDLSRAGGIPQQLQLDRAQGTAASLGGAPRKCCWWPTLTGPRERQLITSKTASATAGGSWPGQVLVKQKKPAQGSCW